MCCTKHRRIALELSGRNYKLMGLVTRQTFHVDEPKVRLIGRSCNCQSFVHRSACQICATCLFVLSLSVVGLRVKYTNWNCMSWSNVDCVLHGGCVCVLVKNDCTFA